MLANAALVLLTLLIVIAAAGGMLYVRLSHGPVSFKFIVSMIEKGINAELDGLTASIDDALLGFDEAGGLDLKLTNLRLSEADGAPVAVVATAAAQLSMPALWAGKLVPKRIDFISPRLSVVYTAEAGLQLSLPRGGDAASPTGQPGTERPGQPPAPEGVASRQVDLTALISAAGQRARQRTDASSYLNQVGLRDAIIVLENRGVRSQWRIAEGTVTLDHRKRRSLVAADLTIASDRGPWVIKLTSEDSETAQRLSLKASIRDVVPRTIGLAVPQFGLLEVMDAPLTGTATLEIASNGTVDKGQLTIGVGRGQMLLPAVADVPFSVDKGELNVRYDGTKRRFDIDPSTLSWGSSHVTIAGAAAEEAAPAGDGSGLGWSFDLATREGQLTAEEFGVAPVKIEQGVLKGRLSTATGEVRIDRLAFKAGKAPFESKGVFLAGGEPDKSGARFEAQLGTTSADVLKVLWPRALAAGGRTWVGERIRKGTVKSATMNFHSGVFARDVGVPTGASRQRRLTLAMEASDIVAQPLRWMSPVEAPRALIRLEDNAIEVAIPDATVVVAPTKRVPVKGGRFAATQLDGPAASAEITFKSTTSLVPVLDLLDQSPLAILRGNGLSTDGVDGKVDGTMKLSLPLIADLEARDVKIEAKARVFDGKAKQVGGAFDVQAANIMIDVNDVAVDAKGDMLVNGVPVKVGWQRILEDTGEKQPPLRLSAVLDNADRTHLGIDINHIVQGEVPVDVLIEKGSGEQPTVRLRADLTNADIALESISWRKPPGRQVSLGADIVKGRTYKYELQNLKVTGEDVAIEGSAGIGADNRLREVTLPGFQLNVITQLDVHALLKTEAGSDKPGTWTIKVRGQTFDGRDLFRSLFAVGAAPEKTAKTAKPQAGIDVDAEIDNVIGHSEVSLRGLKLKLSKRAGKLTFLEARGKLDGGAAVAVSMTPAGGEERRLLADSTDAGLAFKLIGFYPNMQAGRARLELNVDGRGPAEKTGILWVEDFAVLGDPIVSEVISSAQGPAEDGKPARGAKKRAVPQRESIDFDRMKVPFSVGHGQFVIENGYLRGPLLGVNLVGKADFKLRTVNLGGTYVPLQSLNNAFGTIPLFGPIVSGAQGDGAFGITFSVQGPMSQPQVYVNPLSMVAPGIFRELFQMTNPNPKVVPRDETAPVLPPIEKRVRASTPAPLEAERVQPVPATAGQRTPPVGPVDGWSVETTPQRAPAPRR